MLRSDPYLAYVRQHVCMAPGCRRPADVSHHFAKLAGGGGTAVKPHDTYTVPLCADHHEAVHRFGFLRPWSVEETMASFYQEALKLVTRYWVNRRLDRKAKRRTKNTTYEVEAF